MTTTATPTAADLAGYVWHHPRIPWRRTVDIGIDTRWRVQGTPWEAARFPAASYGGLSRIDLDRTAWTRNLRSTLSEWSRRLALSVADYSPPSRDVRCWLDTGLDEHREAAERAARDAYERHPLRNADASFGSSVEHWPMVPSLIAVECLLRACCEPGARSARRIAEDTAMITAIEQHPELADHDARLAARDVALPRLAAAFDAAVESAIYWMDRPGGATA